MLHDRGDFFTFYQLDFSFLKVKFLLVSVIFRIFAKEMTLERRMLAQAKKEYNTRFLPTAPTYKGGRSQMYGRPPLFMRPTARDQRNPISVPVLPRLFPC